MRTPFGCCGKSSTGCFMALYLPARLLQGLLALAALTGCSTQATLVVYTQPPGGFITERGTGRSYGVAPVRIAYDAEAMRAYKDSSGCYRLKGLESRWVSGATTTVDPVYFCDQIPGESRLQLDRSPSEPGLEQDLQFAVQLQSANASRAAAAAAVIRAMPQNRPYVGTITPLTGTPTPTPPQQYTPVRPGMAFLRHQYVSGMHRICVYDRLGSQEIITIGQYELCQAAR